MGGLFYAFFNYDLSYFSIDLKKLTENAFGVAIAVYFLGHVAQAIANQFIKEKKGTFSEREKKVLQQTKEKFNVAECNDGEAFGICYLWALTIDKTGHVSIMNANYGLYRGWTVVLGLQFLFFLSVIVVEAMDHQYKKANFVGLFLSALLCYLMLKRSRRFYKYISDKVFQTFILNRMDSKTS